MIDTVKTPRRLKSFLYPNLNDINHLIWYVWNLNNSKIHLFINWWSEKTCHQFIFNIYEFLRRLYFVIVIASKFRRTLCILFNQSVRNDAHNETYYLMWNRLHIEKKFTRNTTSKVSIIVNHLHSSKLDVLK